MASIAAKNKRDMDELTKLFQQTRINEAEDYIKRRKVAVMNFGRLNPPTRGHYKLLEYIADQAKLLGGKGFIFLSASQNYLPPHKGTKWRPVVNRVTKSTFRSNKSNENPLSVWDKMNILHKFQKIENLEYINPQGEKGRPYTMDRAADYLRNKGYTDIYLVVGTDRFKQLKDKGVESTWGLTLIEHPRSERLEDLTLYSIDKTIPKKSLAINPEAISGTKSRAAAAEHAINGINGIDSMTLRQAEEAIMNRRNPMHQSHGFITFKEYMPNILTDSQLELIIYKIKKGMLLRPSQSYTNNHKKNRMVRRSSMTKTKKKGGKRKKKTRKKTRKKRGGMTFRKPIYIYSREDPLAPPPNAYYNPNWMELMGQDKNSQEARVLLSNLDMRKASAWMKFKAKILEKNFLYYEKEDRQDLNLNKAVFKIVVSDKSQNEKIDNSHSFTRYKIKRSDLIESINNNSDYIPMYRGKSSFAITAKKSKLDQKLEQKIWTEEEFEKAFNSIKSTDWRIGYDLISSGEVLEVLKELGIDYDEVNVYELFAEVGDDDDEIGLGQFLILMKKLTKPKPKFKEVFLWGNEGVLIGLIEINHLNTRGRDNFYIIPEEKNIFPIIFKSNKEEQQKRKTKRLKEINTTKKKGGRRKKKTRKKRGGTENLCKLYKTNPERVTQRNADLYCKRFDTNIPKNNRNLCQESSGDCWLPPPPENIGTGTLVASRDRNLQVDDDDGFSSTQGGKRRRRTRRKKKTRKKRKRKGRKSRRRR